MHSARRGLSQLLIFKFLRYIYIRHTVLRKASRLKSYCKFNNYFLNPHLFLKKSFSFNFRLQIEPSFTPSPIQSLFTKLFGLYGRNACSGRKGLYATMNRWHIDPLLYGDICNLHFRYYFLQIAQFLNDFQR